MEHSEADGQRLVAELMARLAARPVKGRYPAATESSITERRRKLIAISGFSASGGCVAMAGNIVRYADGSAARVVSGAAVAARCEGRPLTLVGSAHNGMVIVQYADEAPITGLLAPSHHLSRVLAVQRVPEACAPVSVMGKDAKGKDKQLGTVVVSVPDEPLSDENPEHVQIASAIEVRLVDQDLLPRFSDL